MCRNITTLYNLTPAVSEDDVRAAALQFVRKISGFTKPSKVNEHAFLSAVDEIAAVSTRLLAALETSAVPRDREAIALRARSTARQRYGRVPEIVARNEEGPDRSHLAGTNQR